MSVTAAIEANEQAIGEDAGRARVVFRTEGKLDGPTHVTLVSRDHTLEVDEPEVLAGGNARANPVEYALASLASCQAITYRFWAAKLGIQLDGLEVAAEGDLDLQGFFGLDAACARASPASASTSRRSAPRRRALPRARRRGRRPLPGAGPVHQRDAGRAPARRTRLMRRRPRCLRSPPPRA